MKAIAKVAPQKGVELVEKPMPAARRLKYSHDHQPCRWLAIAPLGHFTR